jgi:polyisoprenyl-phosphate glycosyltransferase
MDPGSSAVMLTPTKPTLSIVVPAYRSAGCLEELARRTAGACGRMSLSYELILVNDCSPDATWRVICQLASHDPAILGINLRRNFGQDSAIMAGLNAMRGSAVVIMDDDLQHDPDDIPLLFAKLQEGYDVVYANYRRTQQKLWKNLGSWFNGRVAEVVLGKPRDIYLSPYKIVAAEVAAEAIRYRGPYPYIDGLLFRTTSNMAQVTVLHHPRFSGESSFTFWKSVAVWIRLCTNFSVLPLRIATLTGMLSAGIGLCAAVGFLVYRLVRPEIGLSAVGWASTIVSVLVLGGMQLLTIGMLGEYVGHMHLNINGRPQYVERERVRFGTENASRGDAANVSVRGPGQAS